MDAWSDGLKQTLIEEDVIQERVADMGREITAAYQGKAPLMVCILRGAALFFSDLIRRIDLPLRIDFISVSSYGDSTRSSGQVQLMKDLESSIEGIDVILVEDIVDTGLTLSYLIQSLQSRRPASLKICSLLSKPSRREVDVKVDYIGFEIPDKFVVGYGLDYDQQYRNLPYVGVYGSDSERLEQG